MRRVRDGRSVGTTFHSDASWTGVSGKRNVFITFTDWQTQNRAIDRGTWRTGGRAHSGTRLAKSASNNSVRGYLCIRAGQKWHVRVRIKAHPVEAELDGVRLDTFIVGTVRDVSASLGSWLVAQGYADLEMRSMNSNHDVRHDGSIKPIDPLGLVIRRRSD